VAACSDLLRRQQALEWICFKIQVKSLRLEWVKTLRALALIYKPKHLRNGRLDKSMRG
jgi:hypothetical protein